MSAEGKYWVDEEARELVFTDEEGEERFVIEDEVLLDDCKYLVLIPAELADDDQAEAFIMKLSRDGDQEVLMVVEDDNEFERVKEAYQKT